MYKIDVPKRQRECYVRIVFRVQLQKESLVVSPKGLGARAN
jgi:hypothetical protein